MASAGPANLRLRAVHPHLAGGQRIDPEERPRRLGPPRPKEPPEPDDLAPVQRHVKAAEPRTGRRLARLDQPLAALGRRPAELGHAIRGDLVGIAAEHVGDQRELVGVPKRPQAHRASVAHGRHPVADLEELVEEMRHVEHRDPGAPELADHPEEHRGLLGVERRRRLVHDNQARVERDGAGDGHKLLDRGRVLPERCSHVDVDAEPAEDLAGPGVRGAPVDQEPQPPRLVAHHHVLGDRAQWHEVELLVNRGDARRLRFARACDLARRAGEADRAGVAAIDASEDLDERRLARAVLADQRVNLAGRDLKRRAVQGRHAPERLVETGHRQQRLHRPSGSVARRDAAGPGLPDPAAFDGAQ